MTAPSIGTMTLERAVQLGEYEPEYLSQFPEWTVLSKYVQLQYIREGIRNRKRSLMTQYSALNNTLHFSTKAAELEPKLNHIMDLIKQLDRDEEHFLSSYV